ncbi:MAG TPA: DUF3108 domain-containing protein [Anaeromyxobacteraceae bacterium]|nr:DUF3108 domain-containing protein [Anaeromyxobacteraceae bacterium]
MTSLSVVVALTLAADPCGLPALRPGGPPWKTGEVLSFDFDVMGMVRAGTLQTEVGRPMFEGTEIPLKAKVRNSSIFAKVRRIVGGAFSWVGARTLLPERYRDEVVEDGVKKITDARISGSGPVTVETQYGDARNSIPFERQGQVLDVVSAAYYLRAAELKPGEALCFDLVANRRYWRFRGKVAAATERVETPAGIFETVRIDGTVVRADQPAAQRPLHVWIATEGTRPLVAAVSEIDLGPVSATLSRLR